MFSNRVIAILAIPMLLFLYLAWQVDEKYAPFIVPFLIVAAVVFIFKNEIDWWWHSKYPPRMAAELVELLERFCGFYQSLDPDGKQKFRDRVELFKMGNEWMPMGWPEDELPEDVKTILAVHAVALTFHKPDFLFGKFETIIVYPRPFPTEQYQFAHASELYEPDGCLLFSAEQVLKSCFEPAKWYNICLHEYAKAFVLNHAQAPWPSFAEADVWARLEQVNGMPKSYIEAIIGIPDIDPLPVSIHHYFVHRQAFAAIFPAEHAIYARIFGP